MSNKLRRKVEKAMFKKVLEENNREKDGTATAERVMLAMDYIMEPNQPGHNEIASVLTEMLGTGPKFHSKGDIWEEALNRLYPQAPETESDDTIVVDLESD